MILPKFHGHGVLDQADIVELTNRLLGLQALTGDDLIHADVNMDEERNILDIIALVDKLQ